MENPSIRAFRAHKSIILSALAMMDTILFIKVFKNHSLLKDDAKRE